MTITLTHEQEVWLEAHVARGEFASIEDAVRQFIDERIAEHVLIESEYLAWAKNYVDEALADLATGAVMTLDEHLAQIDSFLADNGHE